MAFFGVLAKGILARQAARAAFGSTALGQAVRQAQAASIHSMAGRALDRMRAAQGEIVRAAAKSEVGGAVMKYATPEAAKKTAMSAVWDSLGPVGDVLRGILGRGKGAGARDELKAAGALLRAFGVENVSEVLGPGTGKEAGTLGPRGLSNLDRQGLQVARTMKAAGASPKAIAEAMSAMGVPPQRLRELLQMAGLSEAGAAEAVERASQKVIEELPGAIKEVQQAIQLTRLRSSNIYGIGYDREGQVLFITYRSAGGGQGPSYSYDGVPENIYQEILRAVPFSQDSPGVKAWELLRQPGRRVEPAGAKAQARGQRWIRDGSGTKWGHQFPYDLVALGPEGYVPRQQLGAGLRPRQVRTRGATHRSVLKGTGSWSGQTAQQTRGGAVTRLGGVAARRGAAVPRGAKVLRVRGRG